MYTEKQMLGSSSRQVIIYQLLFCILCMTMLQNQEKRLEFDTVVFEHVEKVSGKRLTQRCLLHESTTALCTWWKLELCLSAQAAFYMTVMYSPQGHAITQTRK